MIAFDQDPTRLASQPDQTMSADVALSLPEIGSICVRAARGAGMSWGHAEETGEAARWLARYGFAWAEIILSRLDGPKGAVFTPKPTVWQTEGPVCGLCVGAALADFARLPEGPGSAGVSLGRVLDPLLVLPFVAYAAKMLGTALRIERDGETFAILAPDQLLVMPSVDSLDRIEALRIAPDTNVAKGKPLVETTARPVAAKLWARLDALALGMTVPATEQSQSGAGAEGSDND